MFSWFWYIISRRNGKKHFSPISGGPDRMSAPGDGWHIERVDGDIGPLTGGVRMVEGSSIMQGRMVTPPGVYNWEKDPDETSSEVD